MVTRHPPDPNAPRIFLDTSVVFSGLSSDRGASYAILTLCQLGLLRPITSNYLIGETERILSEKSPRLLPTFERLQTRINWEFVPEPDDDEVRKWKTLVPENDAPILAAAVLAKVKRLVTLDVKDFIRMPQVAEKSGLMIVTPSNLLVEIRAVLAQGFSK